MLTLADLDRMSRAETIVITPSHETNCSLEQFRELVAAARAWELYQRDQQYNSDTKWRYTRYHGIFRTTLPADHPTPQVAVLAALDTKEVQR